MNPIELTGAARDLISVANRKLGTSRLLAAALLLRQALEEALDSHWARILPAMEAVSGRAQLVSLPFYLDARLAGDVNYAWCRLSAACHHDAYELPPSPNELGHLAEIVDQLARVASAVGPEPTA